ncbi:hypothetical protein RHMOL_Rhmol01G0301400 [Rhododendron molle]|uniref:Uncharacterized protein n=1 Tax=Rhododendron molle TaxID=49168 RepID=A0ACC0Q8S8_RHOML|nr:hypothetical protein RHMOL_Rhmol01G0301400 [Rhododendron molle]
MSGSSSRGKGVQCYSCKKFGHVKRDCPLLKNKGKKLDDASSASSLVVGMMEIFSQFPKV